VFALPTTAVLLGVGPLAAAPTRRTIGLAALCGLVAFLVDVYLYCPTGDGAGAAPAGTAQSADACPAE
jgi:hypothetical protein